MYEPCQAAYNNYAASWWYGLLVEDDHITAKKLWTFIKSQRKDNCSVHVFFPA